MQHSVFGEDALVNVSMEKKEDNDGKLAGYIRIRSKTQGIALSLGDRITSVQRCTADKWVCWKESWQELMIERSLNVPVLI